MLKSGWYPLILWISKFSSPITKPLTLVPNVPVTLVINVTFMSLNYFLVLWQGLSIYLLFLSFILSLWFTKTTKSTIWLVLCVLLLTILSGLVFWPGLCYIFISRNPKEICASHSLGWIFSYTTCSYGQIKFLSQQIVCSRILFLCQFEILVNRFVSITTQPTFVIMRRPICFCFDILRPYVQVFSWDILLICCLLLFTATTIWISQGWDYPSGSSLFFCFLLQMTRV